MQGLDSFFAKSRAGFLWKQKKQVERPTAAECSELYYASGVKWQHWTERKGRGGRKACHLFTYELAPFLMITTSKIYLQNRLKIRFLLKHPHFFHMTTAVFMACFLWMFPAPVACGYLHVWHCNTNMPLDNEIIYQHAVRSCLRDAQAGR